jgi:dCTP deaminase
MILPDHTIADLSINCGIESDPGYVPPLVEPFRASQLQAASYDMRLGHEFLFFVDSHSLLPIDLSDISDEHSKSVVVGSEGFRLNPLTFALGSTMEQVNMPANMAGRLDGKSSLARLGLFIHITGGNIDPGFSGRVTIELFNARRKAIILRPGWPICQIVFSTLASRARRPYEGRYQGAMGVEASKYGLTQDGKPSTGNAIPIKGVQ